MNKSTYIITFLALITLSLFSCKEETVKIDCESILKVKQFQTATHNFEKDASQFLKSTKERSNTFFLRFLLRYSNGLVDFSEMVTDNTISSLKELKAMDDLYLVDGDQIIFNHDSKAYQCLYENFPKNIQDVFDQLKESNYLTPEYTSKALHNQDRSIVENEYIKLYIILQMYYPTIANNSNKKPISLS